MTDPTLLLSHTVPPETSEGLAAALRERLPESAVVSATTVAECREKITEADGLIAGRFSADLLEAAEDLQWVHALSAGVDSYPKTELAERGIALTNSSGVHAEPIGEQVLGYMLAFERRFLDAMDNQQRSTWERVEGGELRGKTVGIIGVGAIGTRVAELASAVGTTVLGTKRDLSTMPDVVDEAFPADEYREVCQRSDYLVLACPLTDETEGLLGREAFRLMASDAVLVNVARGGVVDEEALTRALQYRSIRGAALDVFEAEPLPSDSDLWDLSNVLVTPHMAGSTPKKTGRWTDIVVENHERLAADESSDLRNQVV